ncbi:MAG: heme ABC exporter ATP-binding protein CcmA [Archangiaceae bacterium]|nr:heme ABC exporter ATP-binding protein CcmA [Archangiaceae bacterium]
MADAAFHIVDVSKRYGPRWALARLTFSLERGKSLLLTGHNGSGKTTLLKILATAMSPTLGKLTVLGHDCHEGREPIREKVGLLSHASFLYEDLTAAQNLVVLARLIGMTDGEADATADAMLTRVGLAKRRDHPVRQFSAGMRKRLAVGRLLLKRPELALLDEPFGELDPQGIGEMEKLIAELAAQGTTLVLATHLVDQGKALTTERLHLEEGRRVEARA